MNTPIQKLARELQATLIAVGLADKHTSWSMVFTIDPTGAGEDEAIAPESLEVGEAGIVVEYVRRMVELDTIGGKRKQPRRLWAVSRVSYNPGVYRYRDGSGEPPSVDVEFEQDFATSTQCVAYIAQQLLAARLRAYHEVLEDRAIDALDRQLQEQERRDWAK